MSCHIVTLLLFKATSCIKINNFFTDFTGLRASTGCLFLFLAFPRFKTAFYETLFEGRGAGKTRLDQLSRSGGSDLFDWYGLAKQQS